MDAFNDPLIDNKDSKKRYRVFPHSLINLFKKENGVFDYNAIKYSPGGNKILVDFALKALENESLGAKNVNYELYL